MKAKILNTTLSCRWPGCLAVFGLLLLMRGNLPAQAVVNTLGGGSVSPPYSGYVNGNTLSQAKFAMPSGIALGAGGTTLYIADYTNNAIRLVSSLGNTGSSTTTTWVTNGVSRPIAVVVSGNDVYVLNRGTGANGAVLHFTGAGGTAVPQANLATGLANATAMSIDGSGNLYVVVNGNKVIRVTPAGVSTNIGTITAAGANLQGIAVLASGKIALTDAGGQGIWLMSGDGTSTALTGFHGVGDVLGTSAAAKFNTPETIVEAGGGILVVADRFNNKVKLVDPLGNVSLLYGVSSNLWLTGFTKFPGWADGNAGSAQGSAESRQPYGVAVASDGTVYVVEDFYHVLRKVSNTGLTAPAAPGNPSSGGGGGNSPFGFGSVGGIAFDATDNLLLIANPTNNTISKLDLNLNTNATSFFLGSADGVTNPVAVALDAADNVYVLNQGKSSTNGYVLEFDIYGNAYGPIVTGLNTPTALTVDGFGTLFVTEQAGKIRAFGSGISNTVATVTNANVSLQGIAIFDDSTIAVSDAGNQVIWDINPLTKLITRVTGQLGLAGANVGASNFARLNLPRHLAHVSGNQIIGADAGNNRLVQVTRAGTVTTNHFNSLATDTIWFGNNSGDPVVTGNVKFYSITSPFGVTADASGNVFDSESTKGAIRRMAGTTLNSGGGNPGVAIPFYSGPVGVAIDSQGTVLYVADPTNNTISIINLLDNQTTVFLDVNSGIYQPVDVAVDVNNNVYVLNQGVGGNGSIYKFDQFGNFLGTLAESLPMPTAMKLTFSGDILISELNGLVQKFSSGISNTLANITTNGNVQLQGIGTLDNGSVVVSDAGNHVVWRIPFGSTNAVLLTGIIGTSGTNFGAVGLAKLNKPGRLAQAFGGLLLISDFGNNRVVVANNLGTVSSSLRSTNANIWFGLGIDPVTPGSPNFVPMVAPMGLAVGPGTNATVYVAESYYKDIRGVLKTGLQAPVPPPPIPLNLVAIPSIGQVSLTWSASVGATNYYIKRSPSSGGPYTLVGHTSGTSFIDTGLADGTTWYYVVSALNVGGESLNSDEVPVTLPYAPVTNPQIGYVTFPPLVIGSVFTPVSGSITLNNDAYIVIVGPIGTQTFYTYSNTVDLASLPNPTASSASAPVGYLDGMSLGNVLALTVANIAPALSIKAVAMQTNHPNSAIVSAQFLFVTGNPNIIGNNAAQFNITDITDGARLYYTLDGSDPSSTNLAAFDLGVLTGTNTQWNVSFNIVSNTLFKVRAFKANYQASAVVSNLFTPADFNPNRLTFGTPAGELHSSFQARPGQYLYAPVTLQLIPGVTKMYSLQFNVAVTNGFTNVLNGNPVPKVAPGAGIDFFSMLMTLVPPDEGTFYPPVDGNWYLGLPPLTFGVLGGVTNILDTVFVNTNLNLLGVGFLYRSGIIYTATDSNGVVYLDFDTAKQTLIDYSIAHDTLFRPAGGNVIVGAYSFQVPVNASVGDRYFIQLGSPSATSDGVGAPGSSIVLQAPLAGQPVVVSSPSYVVGDAAPFHWLNAGDFGDTNLDNADVMQVYQSGILKNVNGLGVNQPPVNSDLYAAMDSSGGFGAFDAANNYYTNAGAVSLVQAQAMWDGNDLTINSNAFGDGVLDINDLFVTFRRSLDPSLIWFKRFWTNNMFVAATTPNYAFNSNTPSLVVAPHVASQSGGVSGKVVTQTRDYTKSAITFNAGDAVSGAGSTVHLPITANVVGDYPLRVVGLGITVQPLDGSPGISNVVSFSSSIGSPSLPPASRFAANYNAVWLTASDANHVPTPGWSNNVTLGQFNLTLPPGANGSSAYLVRFDFASGSPNGLALFPKTIFDGLVTTTPRTNSCLHDGIPDSWRLRWFGTTNNILSASNACPSGDGIPNWKKFIAGVDPNVANNFPGVHTKPLPPGATTSIHWPSVYGKKYVIHRATSLFGSPWTVLSTNTGTGGDMEFTDSSTGNTRFYRVEILP